MGEKTDEIEQHIREQRSELSRNISELQQKVKDTVDWKAQFEQHPMTMLGIALGGGFLLSTLIGSRSGSKTISQVSETPTWDSETPAVNAYNAPPNFIEDKSSEVWREIRAALISVGAMKLGSLIDSVVPGFNEEYSKVRGSNPPSDRF